MKEETASWKLYAVYMFILVFMLFSGSTWGQVTATHFNAGWNDANGVSWFMDLKDCSTKGLTDISKEKEAAKKYKIAVIPTIIIFKETCATNKNSYRL